MLKTSNRGDEMATREEAQPLRVNESQETMLLLRIMHDEDMLYEDDDIICFTNPYSLGIVAIEKSTIGEHVSNAIKRAPDNCMQNLRDEIKWRSSTGVTVSYAMTPMSSLPSMDVTHTTGGDKEAWLGNKKRVISSD